MKTQYRARFLIMVLTVYACSCTTPRDIYSPAVPNNPYFTGAGESKLSAYYSAGNGDNNYHYSHGLDVQAAYAPLKNWALTFAHYSRKERDVYPNKTYNLFDSSDVHYKRKLTSFGAGYFVPVGKSKSITFNLYGGFGFGNFTINDAGTAHNNNPYSRYYQSNIHKWFLQPSFNFMPNPYFRLGLISNFSWIHYSGIQSNYLPEELRYFFLDKIANKTLSFWEPALNIQFGIPSLEWLKVDGGFSFCSTTPGDYPNVRNFEAFIGLSADITRLFRNK